MPEIFSEIWDLETTPRIGTGDQNKRGVKDNGFIP
jgi:hypothetical protein